MQLPDDYPQNAPTLHFVTPILHVNVSRDGLVCHALLKAGHTPLKSPSGVYWEYIEGLSRVYRESIESLSRVYLGSIESAAARRAGDRGGAVFVDGATPSIALSSSAFQANAAGLAGGCAYVDGASAVLPDCFNRSADAAATYGAGCAVADDNTAAFWGNVSACGIVGASVWPPLSSASSGGALDASITLLDGFGQAVNGLPQPDAVATVACADAASGCPTLSGKLSVPYDRANASFGAVTKLASSLPLLVLSITVSSAVLAAPISANASVAIVPCAGMEKYDTVSQSCQCIENSKRLDTGACVCSDGFHTAIATTAANGTAAGAMVSARARIASPSCLVAGMVPWWWLLRSGFAVAVARAQQAKLLESNIIAMVAIEHSQARCRPRAGV